MKTTEAKERQRFQQTTREWTRGTEHISLTALRKSQPAKTLTLNFWSSELWEHKFLFLSYLVYDAFLGQSQHTNGAQTSCCLWCTAEMHFFSV